SRYPWLQQVLIAQPFGKNCTSLALHRIHIRVRVNLVRCACFIYRELPKARLRVNFLSSSALDTKPTPNSISGTESLKTLGHAISLAKFNVDFPDDSPARLVFRAVVGCYPYSGCSAVMMTTSQNSKLPPFIRQ